MAVITPNTDLILLKVPLEINDINQLDFANATAQFNYFNSLPKVVVEDYTYQRKDNTIRFGGNFDELISYNYCMYRNTEYSDKWFYAFIVNMEYINDNRTNISIKTDVWQTYMFDLTYKPCLIEREHTNDDTIGSNILPENLELGEFVVNGRTSNFGLGNSNEYMIIMDVSMVENAGTNQTLTFSWSDGSTTMPDSIVNGIPSGCYHILVSKSALITSPKVNGLVNLYNLAGLADAIQNIYILPANMVSNSSINDGLTLSTTGSAPTASVTGLATISSSLRDVTQMTSGSFQKPTTIDGYTPKNNKLLCYPFNYINVTNNAGTTIPFHYEDFNSVPSGYVTFDVEGAFCPSGSIKAVPRNYKNQSYQEQDNAYDYSISGAKYPICSWNCDAYTNWLTQNAVNMQTEWKTTGISAAGEVLGGGLTMGVSGIGLGAFAGGKSLIGLAREQMLAKTAANMVSDQARGNINSGDIVFSKWASCFTFIPMCIKAQYARCADDYLSMFGYATNRVKLPNLTGRRNWNYVKTVGCYIEADIPQEDLAEIKDMFDRGITIWHNPATFADYSQNNDII